MAGKVKAVEETQVEAAQEEVVQEEAKNEVAVKEATDLATAVGAYDLSEFGFDIDELDDLSGIEAINASDIRVPYGKIYAKAVNGRKVGDIELPDGTIIAGGDKEVLKDISILKIQPVRVMFPQPFKPKNTFTCRSFDGKTGANEEASKYPGNNCASCEFSKFPEEGGSSPCREQQLLLCTDKEGSMFYLLVSGIGVGEFKRSFLSVEMMKGLRLVKKQLKKSVLAALNLTVSIEFQETDFGPFPKPIFRVDKEQPLVSKDRLIMNLEAYSGYKEFEDEAVATAATFAQAEQGEHDAEDTSGPNNGMF
jgi:hypothetical protein